MTVLFYSGTTRCKIHDLRFSPLRRTQRYVVPGTPGSRPPGPGAGNEVRCGGIPILLKLVVGGGGGGVAVEESVVGGIIVREPRRRRRRRVLNRVARIGRLYTRT